jgi:hypothetical protein
MANVKYLHSTHIPNEDQRKERYDCMMSLAELKASGMTYTAMSKMFNISLKSISKQLKPYETKYADLVEANFARLEQSVQTVDLDYAYITDPRTVRREMYALQMGGKRIRNALEELADGA